MLEGGKGEISNFYASHILNSKKRTLNTETFTDLFLDQTALFGAGPVGKV